jgi:hypothetical protein
MRGFFKTLLGDARTVTVAGLSIAAAALVLHTALAPAAGLVLPLLLLGAAAYLAKH